MPALKYMGMSNAMFNNNNAVEPFESARPEPQPQPPVQPVAADLGAEARQDMFVYGVKSLGLKKGARAMVQLWRNKVSQRHVYTVEFGSYASTVSDGAPLKLAENKVWHQLELTDDTDVPFTTGAAMVMEDGMPLGQDLLAYTPSGGKTMIPITTALNMGARHSEREVGRTTDAKTVNGYKYVLVRKKGSIAVASHEKQRATMRIRFSTLGIVEHASNGGTVVRDENDQVNNHSTVTWEVDLAPGQTVNLEYDLSVFR
jgi:hypothetical protein